MVKELEEANQALEIEQEKRAQDCADLKQAINNLEQKIADQATNLYQLQVSLHILFNLILKS